MKQFKITLVFTLIGLFYSACHSAQELSPEAVGERIESTSVTIFNNADARTTILLGQASEMDTFKLKARDVWHSPAYEFNPKIKINSLNRSVKYQLKLGNYYMIYWNERKKCWDIKQIDKKLTN